MVWLVDSDDAGWLADEDCAWLVEDAAWFVEADAAGWFAEADAAGWLAEADAAGCSAEADGWFAEADDGLDDAEATELRPGMSAFACFALSIAACVRGPMMPSTGPGSKPLSFSACWSCFTDSSPLAAGALLTLEPLVELDAIAEGWFAEAEAAGWFAEAEAAGWFADAEAAGWLVDAAGWFAEAEVAGWLADADFSLSAGWFPAIAVPAAIRAAARASFLNFMVCVLSYGQLTAVRFGSNEAIKLQQRPEPSDARRLRVAHGVTAT